MVDLTQRRRAPSGAPGAGFRRLDTRPLTRSLAGVTLLLVVVNLVVKVLADPPRDMTAWLVAFDVNRERNFPTMWNAGLLLGITCACVLVASLTPRGARMGRLGWVLPGAVAGVMAVDEMLQLHEQLRGLGATMLDAVDTSVPTYVWIVPGVLLALAGLACVLVWSRRLPADVRRPLRLGVLVFLAGALGLEAASGWVDVSYGTGRAYTVVTAAEELLEMTGCILALAAVLRMLRAVDVGGRAALVLRADA